MKRLERMLAEAAAAAAKAAEAQPSQGQKIWRDELEAEEASLLQKFTRMDATIRKIQDQKKKDEARLRKIRGQLATIPNGDRAAGFCRTLDEEHAHNEMVKKSGSPSWRTGSTRSKTFDPLYGRLNHPS
ncbi:hypothetical protein V496_04134 [Pseudogymnoascus sp. VKM F-4515 (FW-2607)]|nr:hypothetical protein V496_04134 [Pseudogymnoascus sp. VKM F-4515 (FW-2607)]